MAFLWLWGDGDGVAVTETASEVKRRFESEESNWIGLTLDTRGDEEPWKRIYIDRDRVLAIEQGQGVVEEEQV